MSELEKLHGDLAAVDLVIEMLDVQKKLPFGTIQRMRESISERIKELEDPHARAKDLVKRQRENRLPSDFLADYAAHLEDEVERLKTMLANASTIESELLESKSKLEDKLKSRPVVWCLKNYQGATYTSGLYNTIQLFPSMLQASEFAKNHGYYWLKADVYKGKESK